MTQECSNHHPYQSTPRSKGLSRSKIEWSAIYTNLPINAIVRLPTIFCYIYYILYILYVYIYCYIYYIFYYIYIYIYIYIPLTGNCHEPFVLLWFMIVFILPERHSFNLFSFSIGTVFLCFQKKKGVTEFLLLLFCCWLRFS